MRNCNAVVTVVLAALVGTGVRSEPRRGSSTSWHDSTRDVFIDNELDRAAQFLTADNPARAVLVSSKLELAIILDINSSVLQSASKDAFKFSADRSEATSEASTPVVAIGRFTRIDGPIYSFAVDGKPVLIRVHPGLTGEMNLDRLWETVPVWKATMENYKPGAADVAALNGIDKETNLTLLYGTWCGDSKYYIPRLLKALSAASNRKLHVKLVGIDNQFREPADTVQSRRLTNVPTVIVERDGREIGRVVETPATKTFEQDLAAILTGKSLTHNGRWDRGPLIAKGVYSYTDQKGRECGSELWELFVAAEGGYFVHSRITLGDLSTEVYERVDNTSRPAFAEITQRQGNNVARTRITIDRSTMTARVRGNSTGVVLQTIEVPGRFFLSTPAMAGLGLIAALNQRTAEGYVCPSNFESTAGALVDGSCIPTGDETLRTSAGEFRARRFTIKTGKESMDLWLHPTLTIPVKVKWSSGLECALSLLEAQSAGK